jgi:hypothetical protein
MTDLGSTSFSQTDSSNDPAGSAAPNTIDNNIREIKGAVTREWNHRSYTVTAGGTEDAKTLTYSVAPDAYRNGQRYAFIANTTNTGTCTLNVNGLGAKTIKKDVLGTLTALAASDMVAGMFVEVAFNASDNSFVWVNRSPALPSLGALASLDTVSATEIDSGAVTTAKIAANAVDGTKIALGSDAQGDVMYYSGTDWVRLGAGTSGQYLKTNGAAANPEWATVSSTGGADVLGTIATTSGASASLGSLVLTDYKVIELWVIGVSFTGSNSELLVGNSTSDDVDVTLSTPLASETISGIIKIDLADGVGVSTVYTSASTPLSVGRSFDTALSTSTTTITVATDTGFDAGSIRVIGYK